MKLAEILPELAKKEVGTEEINGSNKGPRVDEYKAATFLPAHESWPWCAAFIDWLVMNAMKMTGKKYTFDRPQTAGAWDLENWSLAQDESTSTKRNPGFDILAGDIVIFKFSHVGLAIANADHETATVKTVEGNTDQSGSREGGGVFTKRRKLSQIKTRIRFTV